MSDLLELLRAEFPAYYNATTDNLSMDELAVVLTSIIVTDTKKLASSRLFAEPVVLNMQLNKSVAGNVITQSIGTYLADNSSAWPMNPLLTDKTWSITDEVEQSLAHKVARAGNVELIYWAERLTKPTLMLQDAVGCSVGMYLAKCKDVWSTSNAWQDNDFLQQEDIAGQSLAHYLASAQPSWSKSSEAMQKRVMWIGARSYLGQTVGEALAMASPHQFGRIYSSILNYGIPLKFTDGLFKTLDKYWGRLELAENITEAVLSVYETYFTLGFLSDLERVSWLAGFYSNLRYIPENLCTAVCIEFTRKVEKELTPLLKTNSFDEIVLWAGGIAPVSWYEPAQDLSHIAVAAVNFGLDIAHDESNDGSFKSVLY